MLLVLAQLVNCKFDQEKRKHRLQIVPQKIFIGAILPLSGELALYTKTQSLAIRIAEAEINQNPNILPDHSFTITWINGKYKL